MKTPHEILWDRHRSVEPKLDEARRKALTTLTAPRTSSKETETSGFREMLLSLRWHLAGMGVAWIFVALLNIDHSPSPVAGLAKENIPSPQRLLAALRENRRQIAALLESPASTSEPSPTPPTSIPKPRSELQSTESKGHYG